MSSNSAPTSASHDSARPLPLVALVGRPNAGKSSLYNALTGGQAHVGNFPGITVDILEAEILLPGVEGASPRRMSLVDLPGVYSLEASADPATDEGVAQRFFEDARQGEAPVDLVVQVLDGTRLELGLRLTEELTRRPERLVLVITQADILRAEGKVLRAELLEARLGVPVVLVASREGSTRPRVLEALARTLASPARSRSSWQSSPAALAAECMADAPDADARTLARRRWTERADALLLHPMLGPLTFLSLMTTAFAAVFLVADPASALIDTSVELISRQLGPWVGEGWLHSLLVDGLLGGAGTVLGFMPQILILGMVIELLEASGYLARGAFLVDRLLRGAGLGGRSFVPLLMGHACAIPAITATRIVRNPLERLATILVVPLMTCSARIPTYGLLIAAFFPDKSAWFRAGVFVALYFAGILLALLASAVLRRTAVRGRGLPMILELPAYRAPQPRALLASALRTGKQFVRDVGKTIVIASVVLWGLLHVPWPGSASPDPSSPSQTTEPSTSSELQASVAAHIGHAIEPMTRPLGFDWRVNVGLIASFGARELMVSTMGVIFGVENPEDEGTPLPQHIREAREPDGRPSYSVASGLSLLAFFVVACQCMSTLAVIKRETRSLKWPAIALGYTYALAWALAFVTFQTARALGLG